jgi:hypothetical protein
MTDTQPLIIRQPEEKIVDGGKTTVDNLILQNTIDYPINYKITRLDKDQDITLSHQIGRIPPQTTETIQLTYTPKLMRLTPLKLEIEVQYDFIVD